LRHVVLLTWEPDAEPEAIRAAVAGVAGLPALIPELTSYSFGADLGIVDGNADFAIVGDFDDPSAWRRYLEHPEHQRVLVELIRPIIASRVAVQVPYPGDTAPGDTAPGDTVLGSSD
jgi:hypothetical protein